MSEDIKSSIIAWIQAQPLWAQKACKELGVDYDVVVTANEI